jgi:RHS repeat-associated protein
VVAIHAAGTIQVDPQTGLMSGSPGPRLKQYRHDALGCRVRTTDPSGVTRHVYGSGAEVLAENAVGGTTETILREFVWGGPGAPGFPDPLVLVDYTGAGGGTLGAPQRFYLLKDVQGSVGALTVSTGQVVERFTYTPYGQTQITAADGTTPRTESLYGNPFAYTGQRYEPQTGLYHFWARVYSPTLGRFLQEDAQGVLVTASIALGYQGGAPGVTPPVTGPAEEYPDLLNLYAYAMGNPLRFTDPLGQFSYAEMGMTMGVQGILGGLISGAMTSAFGGDFWDGFASGAIGGAFGGLGGYLANAAFAASASGFFGTLIAYGVVGGIDGGVGAFAQSMYADGDIGTALVDSMWGFAIGAATAGMVDMGGKYLRGAFAKLRFGEKRLKHMFNASGGGNHAKDFGVTGTWSKANGEQLKAAIEAHVKHSMAIQGTYRGTMRGTHYFDSSTGLWVFQKADGEFYIGWKLFEAQMKNLWRSGNVQ